MIQPQMPIRAAPYDLAVLAGNGRKKAQTLKALRGPQLQLAVVNYESAWRLELELRAWQPDLIICDEGHKIKSHTTNASKAMHRLGAAAKYRLLRLSQLTGGFVRTDEGALRQVSKAKLAALEDIIDGGGKMVVIARFVPEIHAITALLESKGIGYSAISGEVKDRKEQIARFQSDPECRVFVGQIATAGLGITLTAASTMVFYSLDYLTAERKNKDPFTFRPYARLLFSCNAIPRNYGDKSEGFYRRLIIIRFSNPVSEEKRDTELLDKFAAKADGIFLFAVEGLRRLIANKYKFSEIDATRAELQRYRIDSNSVLSFVEECCTLDPQAETERAELFTQYREYCHNAGLGAASSIMAEILTALTGLTLFPFPSHYLSLYIQKKAANVLQKGIYLTCYTK